jgi:hypothetical protein
MAQATAPDERHRNQPAATAGLRSDCKRAWLVFKGPRHDQNPVRWFSFVPGGSMPGPAETTLTRSLGEALAPKLSSSAPRGHILRGGDEYGAASIAPAVRGLRQPNGCRHPARHPRTSRFQPTLARLRGVCGYGRKRRSPTDRAANTHVADNSTARPAASNSRPGRSAPIRIMLMASADE